MAAPGTIVRISSHAAAPRPEPLRGVAVFLHGFTGDKHSMDVLEPALAEGWWRLSPRAPFAAVPGGFSWAPDSPPAEISVGHFQPAAEALRAYLDQLALDRATPLALVGFSQGAAMAIAAVDSGQVSPSGLAVLSGFIPSGISPAAFAGLPVFWSHGMRDERVTIDRARADVRRLEQTGARIRYCEADVGHKVGLPCVRGLRAWLRDLERGARRDPDDA